MSPYMALYLKELKANRLVSAVMLVATAVIVVVVVSDASDGALHATLPLLVLPYLSPPVLAALLMHSISQEWSGNTQQQWLALPVPHSTLPLVKLAAVGTLALGVFVLNTLGLQLILEQTLDILSESVRATGLEHIRIEAADMWSTIGGLFGSMTALMLGLGLAASSFRILVPRFKGLVTASVFLGGFWLTGRLADTVGDALHSGAVVAEAHQSFLYLAGMGVLFAGLGAYLFDRHVDA